MSTSEMSSRLATTLILGVRRITGLARERLGRQERVVRVQEIVLEQHVAHAAEQPGEVARAQGVVRPAENGRQAGGVHERQAVVRDRQRVATDPEDVRRGAVHLDVIALQRIDAGELHRHDIPQVARRLGLAQQLEVLIEDLHFVVAGS